MEFIILIFLWFNSKPVRRQSQIAHLWLFCLCPALVSCTWPQFCVIPFTHWETTISTPFFCGGGMCLVARGIILLDLNVTDGWNGRNLLSLLLWWNYFCCKSAVSNVQETTVLWNQTVNKHRVSHLCKNVLAMPDNCRDKNLGIAYIGTIAQMGEL